ncbi:MAG: hypothetical protein E7311_00865 [Clostridiales bacterium]|nr:hypothetical protein [Clostridiales bacterium]
MQELKAIVRNLENRKTELEYELEYTQDTLSGMEDYEKSTFEGDVKKIENKISTLSFEIDEANKVITKLEDIKREIDKLDREEEKIAPYRGAKSKEVQELREKSNELEDKYAELYNQTLYRLQDI